MLPAKGKRPFCDYRLPLQRVVLKRGERKKGPLIAYDFETTRIPTFATQEMRVKPLYLTAYGEGGLLLSRPLLRDMAHTAGLLESEFLTDARLKARYVAWNGNRFDVRIVLDAIVEYLPAYAVTPFWAGMAGLRGALVYDRANPKRHWYFLDGIAMTGLTGMPLRDFMPLFAPAYSKGTIEFESVEFNPRDPAHVAYAERDSEGLYHAMIAADKIMFDLTGRGLQVTIGNAGIKFFQSKMPEGAQVWPSPGRAHDLIQKYGKRGGYVFTARSYMGPLWSYDINQAYGAAMRETALPCGFCSATQSFDEDAPGVYVATIARAKKKAHPFYARQICDDPALDGGAVECYGEELRTMLTSDEVRYLREDGWSVRVHEGWVWMGSFTMKAMVDDLEHLRSTCAGGPSGPIGTLAKAIGNHSYGKTGENISNEQYTFAADQPSPDAQLLNPIDPDMRYFWFEIRDGEERRKRYHRPIIAMFVTASVRMKLLRAIDGAPREFIKADTDSVSFNAPIAHLPLSKTVYGAWKEEYAAAPAIVIGKKTYAIRKPLAVEGPQNYTYVVKGLRVRELRYHDFLRWYESGVPPSQPQIQTLSLKRGLGVHSCMYRAQVRRGTNFAGLASVHKRDAARAWWEAAWTRPQ